MKPKRQRNETRDVRRKLGRKTATGSHGQEISNKIIMEKVFLALKK